MLAASFRVLAALLALSSLAACTADRGLKLTEVGVGVVELYLDEPSDKTLRLDDVELRWMSHGSGGSAPEQGTIELSGSIDGGDYLVLFEETGHTGPPARRSYTNYDNQGVPGMAVAVGTFGTVDNARSYAYRVYQKRYIYIFPFFYRIEEVDDVVTFGPTPRPAIGGAFLLNGDLDNVQRTPTSTIRGQTVWRKTRNVNGVDVPRDTDTEENWRQDDESYGKAK